MAGDTTNAAAGETMKAMQYSGYGGGPESLKLVEIPRPPAPKKGELLVKVEASGVNGIDWKIQDSLARPFLPAKFPHTPGLDITGEVISVGPNVEDFAKGDKIASVLEMKNGGGLAEYAIALCKYSAKMPAELSILDAAGLPVAGLTALQALTNAGVNIDRSYSGNILITAAAGGVGLYAVQLAKMSGAHVTATVGERNMQLVKDYGADEVLDYKTDEGAKLLSPSGKKYDVVINGANGVKWSTIVAQLAPTAQVQELQPGPYIYANAFFKKVTMAKQKRLAFMMAPNEKDLTFLADLQAKGKLKMVVDQTFPLEKAGDAWAKSKEGHATGKIIVTIP